MGQDNRGRLSMAIHPLSYFTGEDGVAPFDGELCYDDDTLDILIWHVGDDGTYYTTSETKSIKSYLDELKNSGVFTAANAFVNNRKIYRFFFDQVNGVVRLDPDLRFDPLYRYYSIRKTQFSESGAPIYVTGLTGEGIDGETVISHLVDINLEYSESGDGTQVGVPQVGGLASEVTNGDSYVVEFWGSNRELLNMQIYQAIAVRTTSLDLAPDTAVTDISLRSTQSKDNNTIYFYRGQDVGSVELEVWLTYADGRQRNITNENTLGGRLTILGLDDLNTGTVTAEGEDPQQIEIVYKMIRTGESIGTTTQETPSGAIISPSSLTISKKINVYIEEDPFNDIAAVIPAAYVTGEVNNEKINLKFFALYANGRINDVSNIAKIEGFVNNSIGTTQTVTVRIPYGNAGNEKVGKMSLIASRDNLNNISIKITNIDGLKTTGDTRYVIFDKSLTAAGIYSGKFTGFAKYDEATGTIQDIVYSQMLTSDVASVLGTPTHIRVRDIIDPTFTYTYIIDASSGAYFTADNMGHEINKNRALLVEFFKIEQDDNGNAISAFATGAAVHYARENSTNG